MENLIMTENDELIMKLLHYFVTEQNYNPIILKGVQNEIWLENLQNEYKVVRLVSNYIHNDSQMEVDIKRTEQIVKSIKKKTMSFNMKVLSIYINLGDNVSFNDLDNPNNDLVGIKEIDDLKKYEFILDEFPTITKCTEFKEKGMELFMKLTSEISNKNDKEAKKAEDIFTKKEPIITKILLIINVIVFILTFMYGEKNIINFGSNFGPLVKQGQVYRLITSMFIHVDFLHIFFNCYALYVIGPQIENFFGKWKYLLIYLGSGITAGLLSILFNGNTASIGASGAIFGLLGALIYFGYHYRVYLDSVIKSQIIPIIIINLLIGFMSTGIDNAAHIGGLIGGTLFSIAVGVKYKSSKSEIINGIIMTLIFISFLAYMVFIH